MGRSLKVSPDNKKRVKDAVKRNGYPSQKQFAIDIGLSQSTVQSFLNGRAVDFGYFVEICQHLGLDWQEISAQETTNNQTELPSPLTYDSNTWVGREETLRELKLKLQGEIRLLVITGLTGQGKTALGEKLTRDLLEEGKWHYLSPVNFDDATTPRDFVGFAGKLLTELGEELSPDNRNNEQFLLNKLMAKLRHRAYLLQFDSLEVVLEGNAFKDRWWEEFFNSFLANSKSRFILTSQVFPRQLRKRYNEFLGEHKLSGLSEEEQWQLWQKLFAAQSKDLQRDSLGAKCLEEISKVYEGHPLVIKVIAGEILDSYEGDVEAYYQKYEEEFTAIEHSDTHEGLEHKVRARVRVALSRLKEEAPTAYSLLFRSSVFRLAVVAEFWFGMLQGVRERDKKKARNVLESRCLVIEERNLLRQHNLIRSTAYGLLQEEDHCQEVHREAARLWLQEYEVDANAENLVKVRGYLEAFYHYCEIEAWEDAGNILAIEMDTPTQEPLGDQLDTWGYYRQKIDLYHQLLGKLDDWQSILLTGLGNAYFHLGEYQKTIHYNQQGLEVSRAINNSRGESVALGSLGNVYHRLGNYPQAINHIQQHLVIAEEIGDHRGEAIGLSNLGNVYCTLREHQQALRYYHQSVIIDREIGSRKGEGIALGNLGNVYRNIGEYHQAIEYYQQSVIINREIGNRHGEGTSLGNLGHTYSLLGDHHQSLDYYQQYLDIAKKIGDRSGKSMALCGLGAAYHKLGEYHKAIDYHQHSLMLAKEIGDRNGESSALSNLGNIYNSLEKYQQAIEHYEKGLAVAREVGERDGEGTVLGNLGNVYYKLGDHYKAIDYQQQSLNISREIGDRHGEGNTLSNLGNIYDSLGKYQQAIDYYQKSLAIAREIGNRDTEGCASGNLGNIYNTLEDYDQAMNYYSKHLAIAREIDDRLGESIALSNLGVVYEILEDYHQAMKYYNQHLDIAEEIGDQNGEGIALGNLGNVYNSLGNYYQAINYHQQHLDIAKEIGNRNGEGTALGNLGIAHESLGDYLQAINYHQQALNIFREIYDRNGEATAFHNLALANQQLGNLTLAKQQCQQALKIATELGIPLVKECQELQEKLGS